MKCFAFDIDGTLINNNHEITPKTLNALKKCIALGYNVVIVTGRNYDLVMFLLNKYSLKLDVICNSGHEFVSSDGKDRIIYPMSDETTEKLLNLLIHYDYHISIFSDTGKYAFTEPEHYFEKHMSISEKKRGMSLENLSHIPFFNKEVFLHNYHHLESIQDLLNNKINVLKIDARNMNREKLKESLPLIESIDEIVIDSSYEGFLECSEKSINKATMLLEYIHARNIDKHDTYIFGDSMNDLELFIQFDNTFAVSNAHEEIKKLAKWVVSDNENDGVAEGIEFILNTIN